MEAVVQLFANRVRCLNGLLRVSKQFLILAEKGQFEKLDQYEKFRDSALKAIQLIESKTESVISDMRQESVTTIVKNQLRLIQCEEKQIIRDIMELDTKLYQLIETEKERIQRAIHASERSIKITGKYKSEWVQPSGEELDRQV